jgi:UV DNA damage endonuclease
LSVRLGYACINLSLQSQQEGPRLRGLTAKRLSTMEPQQRRSHLYAVARSNLKTVAAHLRWNAAHNIHLYRITSELVPLVTHPVAADWQWEEDLAEEFSAVARVAREADQRLTTHPGQYSVLNAREPDVVRRAMADLAYHARMLELLQTGPESGMVLHVGGAYGDKEASARRFAEHFRELPPNVADRLWVENDDVTWDTAAALAVAQSVGRPMVLDIHHHRVLREDDWLPWLEQVLPTWGAVRPKLHYSTPRDGARSRFHADRIDAADFAVFLERTRGLDLDVMLECKTKDRALLDLRRELDAMGLDSRTFDS